MSTDTKIRPDTERKASPRRLLMVLSFLVLILGSAAVFVFFPDRWWLVAIPVAAWGGLFLTWAALWLKDPDYYGA